MENEKEFVGDFSTCRQCQCIKVRKVAGSFDGINKKYVDEDGKLWNGRHCASCHKLNVKNRLQERRKEAKDADS